MMRRTASLAAVAACVAAAGIAGCGGGSSKASSSATTTAATTRLAKTRFVLHAALAFGAFHHFIYLPARDGELAHPLRHKLAMTEAALAAAFTYHELKLAAADVRSSKVLRTLFAPLTIAADKIQGLATELRAGRAPVSEVNGIDSSLTSIQSTASSNGQGFNDAVPSLARLREAAR